MTQDLPNYLAVFISPAQAPGVRMHASPATLPLALMYESYYNARMPTSGTISTLSYALLGLIKMRPSTGYDLRKVFQETPMARYSSSPGAIYPALRGLETQSLIRHRPGLGKTGREIQTWFCTVAGTRKLQAWLRRDVTTNEMFQALDVVLLRFSFLDLLDDLDWSIEFLQQFREAAQQCGQRVKGIRDSLQAVQPLHGQLALSNGVEILTAHARWAQSTLTTLRRKRGRRP